jgi:predicted ribosomally synthesized peptide with nif11-like leader
LTSTTANAKIRQVILFAMSSNQLTELFQSATKNPSLHEKLIAASSDSELIAIGQEHGFSISAEDISSFKPDLTDEDLAEVAGGAGENWIGGEATMAWVNQGSNAYKHWLEPNGDFNKQLNEKLMKGIK